MGEEQEAVSILRLLAIGTVDVLDLGLGGGPPVLSVRLLPLRLPSLGGLVQGEPLRLASEWPIEQSHEWVVAAIMPVLHSLAGAPVLGSGLLPPFGLCLLTVEVVAVVHLRATVVLSADDTAWVPDRRDHLGDVSFLPLGWLELLLLDVVRHGVNQQVLEVALDDLGGHVLQDALPRHLSASLVVPLLGRHHVPHGVLAHVRSLGWPSVPLLLLAAVPLVDLVGCEWWHVLLLLGVADVLLVIVVE